MRKFLVRHWFVLSCSAYGFIASAVGADLFKPAYWVGLIFGAVVYIGCQAEDRS
jgi:hypothetical protein